MIFTAKVTKITRGGTEIEQDTLLAQSAVFSLVGLPNEHEAMALNKYLNDIAEGNYLSLGSATHLVFDRNVNGRPTGKRPEFVDGQWHVEFSPVEQEDEAAS